MRVMRVKDVDVNVHWTVLVVGAIRLLNAGRKPVLTLVGLVCYLSVLLIHECGHLIAAQRRGSRVLEIRLYPIHGKCLFQRPWSRFDHCVIAWGGVIAGPLVLGHARFEAINTFVRAQIQGCHSERAGRSECDRPRERNPETVCSQNRISKEFWPIIVPGQELCCPSTSRKHPASA
ncbi:MAG TPA: hypothetical protein VFP59_19885 [Candidatus Angelobacter sp.]|nr:hypothetical protein [Candidatus Angelobacter sp.]